MLVLVVDTAGSVGGVLLARNEGEPDAGKTQVLGEGRLEPREFSTQLIPAIAELLQANRLALLDLDAFAVVSGPGSFTGLRVGLSAVKAMAEVTGKPVIALSRLAIMASSAPDAELVHALLDAGRGEFYHGIYRDFGRTCIAESLQTQTSLAASFKNVPGLVVASEGVVLDTIGKWADVNLRPISAVTAREALPLTVCALCARGFVDVARLDANYLRRLDVEGVRREPIADSPASGL